MTLGIILIIVYSIFYFYSILSIIKLHSNTCYLEDMNILKEFYYFISLTFYFFFIFLTYEESEFLKYSKCSFYCCNNPISFIVFWGNIKVSYIADFVPRISRNQKNENFPFDRLLRLAA